MGACPDAVQAPLGGIAKVLPDGQEPGAAPTLMGGDRPGTGLRRALRGCRGSARGTGVAAGTVSVR